MSGTNLQLQIATRRSSINSVVDVEVEGEGGYSNQASVGDLSSRHHKASLSPFSLLLNFIASPTNNRQLLDVFNVCKEQGMAEKSLQRPCNYLLPRTNPLALLPSAFLNSYTSTS